MKTYFYKIQALTNMHPGSGDTNFGVVDNMVQRDPATDLPVIHGSSLKGAIKEFFKPKNVINLEKVFGNNDNHGEYRFLPAMILAIPLRSNDKPYYMATSPDVIRQFLDLANELNFKLDEEIKKDLDKLKSIQFSDEKLKATEASQGLIIEDYENIDLLDESLSENTKNLLGITNNNLVILPDGEFVKMTDSQHLPVVARNQLENGQSKNLWYEQVIPRITVFIKPLLIPENDDEWSKFNETLIGEPVQIGGNASVGYGFTRFSLISQN